MVVATLVNISFCVGTLEVTETLKNREPVEVSGAFATSRYDGRSTQQDEGAASMGEASENDGLPLTTHSIKWCTRTHRNGYYRNILMS